MTKPLVSVMMPAFNTAQFLPSALDSLIAQTYSHWEAVVVDDGSTDKTAEVLRSYAAKDHRIKPVFSTHGGRGIARNRALKHCSGEFVALLDSDDVAIPDRFEKQVAFLQSHPDYGVVSGQCVSFSSKPALDPRKLMPWPTDPDEIRRSLLRGRMRILNGGSMIRKRVFDKLGGYRPELKRAQDYEFFRRVALAGVRLAALPDVVILYRQNRLIPSIQYYLESELYRHYANALHDGSTSDFSSFARSSRGRLLSLMTRLKYVYLFSKLAIRYRRLS